MTLPPTPAVSTGARSNRISALGSQSNHVIATSNLVLPLIVVAAAIIAQSPALGHFFRGDDFLHLYQIEDLGFWRFILTPHAGHVEPTTLGVFYLCRVLFDLNANGYYAVGIATHAFNVYLVYRIVETSTRRLEIAFAAAFIWGTSSLNEGSIGWYSVYGHVLAGTFTLLFLRSVARVASGDRELTRATPWLWIGYVLAAAASFGSGIPVAMLSGTALYLLLPDMPGRVRAVRTLSALWLVVPALFLAVHWTYYDLFVAQANGPVVNKTLAQQIAGVLPSLWLEIISMFSLLLSNGIASLLFGPLFPLTGWSLTGSAWIAYGFTAALVLALGISVWRVDPAVRPRALGYLLLVAGCYGIIALARASFYNTFGLTVVEASAFARYHYAAPAILSLLLASLAAGFLRPVKKPWLRVGMVAGVLLLAANWSASRVVVDMHPADAGEIYAKTIKAFDAKIRSQRKGTNVVIENKPFAGAGWGRKHIPGLATIFIIHFPENVVDGRCVYFREKDPERLEYWRSLGGNRLRDLLIAPGDRSLKRRCRESK